MNRALHRLGLTFVTLSVLVCVLGSIAVPVLDHFSGNGVLLHGPQGATTRIRWYRQSIGVSHCGYGPVEDSGGGSYPVPYYLFCVSLPLWAWGFRQRPIDRLTPFRRALARGAAACPACGLFAALYAHTDGFRNDQVTEFVLCVLLLLPFWFYVAVGRFRRARAARRLARGLCPTCAYDLRASPEPGGPLLDRCPECGTATPPVTSAAGAVPLPNPPQG